MIYVGIDPGKSGALAALDPVGALLDVRTMPIVTAAKGRPEYKLGEIRELLIAWRAMGAFVTVEKQAPMPPTMGGVIANYSRGVAMGWGWMLTALNIPHTFVSPQTWQKRMLAGAPGNDTKQRAAVVVERLWPGKILLGSKVQRVGFRDALLIAEWGRRDHAVNLTSSVDSVTTTTVAPAEYVVKQGD